MAKMIPPYIHRDVKSNAEKRIYTLIQNDLQLKEWTCIHSLGLAEHTYKIQGEIDFLMVGPKGVLCLEVKGGNVKRKDGLWYFSDKYGQITKKTEGPFRQIADAHFSLKQSLSVKFPEFFSNILFGYGVLFPDIEFNISSIEWSNEIIYNRSDRLYSFSLYVERLVKFWEMKCPQKNILSNSEIQKIVDYLRGDFEIIKPLNFKLDEREELSIRFTKDQYRALDQMEFNDRMFFRGTAGTGKTLLAIEKARRLAATGKKVLLLCFNKILAAKLNSLLAKEEVKNTIEVESLHKYFLNVIKRSIWYQEFKVSSKDMPLDKLYRQVYPNYFIKAIHEVNEEYNYLIIDEGQDFLYERYFIALDYILKGGLACGHWTIFYDPSNQAQMYNNFDEALVGKLKGFGAAEYYLDFNCRNTKPIVDAASLVSGYAVEKTRVQEGEPVEYLYYVDDREQIELLKNTITNLQSNGLSYGDITILYPENSLEDRIIKKLEIDHIPIKITYENVGLLDYNRVSYCSVQAYKGLENKIIILIGLEELENDWISSINYVAMTRAKQMLVVLLNRNLRGSMGNKFINFIQSS
ncbi:MAG: NERD domain-containing protein [Clostridiaceae bacterium]|nr:NERD domain-containing protein [Clostridiaceae bacterium]